MVEDKGFIVSYHRGTHKVSGPNGHVFFKHIPERLHTLNLDDPNNQINNNQVALIQTIEHNKEGFTKRQIQ